MKVSLTVAGSSHPARLADLRLFVEKTASFSDDDPVVIQVGGGDGSAWKLIFIGEQDVAEGAQQ